MYYKRKQSKINWPVILILMVVIAFVFLIAFLLLKILKKDDNQGRKYEEKIKPTIEVSVLNNEQEQKNVDIIVKAQTADENGLDKIILPGSEEEKIEEGKKAYETKYTAKKNGEYQFQVYGKNGVFESATISVKNIKEISAKKPYIPEGFKVLEDAKDPEKGMVVVDKFGNEFVWVPLIDNKSIRNRDDADRKFIEDTEAHSKFLNSINNYFGYYISRYEISKEVIEGKEHFVSKQNRTPVHGVSYVEAKQYAENFAKDFGYKDMESSLVSSTAWDTMLHWVEANVPGYRTSLSYGNYTGQILKTGTYTKDKVCNIYDLAGNLKEWTTEKYKLELYDEFGHLIEQKQELDYRITRGGSSDYEETPNKFQAVLEQRKDQTTGFRVVLYIK